MSFKKGNPGCPCCNCTTSVQILRPGGCPAIGAAVEFRDGGTLVFSGVTGTDGRLDFPDSIPGHTYDVAWTFEELSGTSTGITACTTRVINIANPVGYSSNCPVQIPTLYKTDGCGTHQIWPDTSAACFSCTSTGPTRWWKCTLIPSGTCASPVFRTQYDEYTGAGCAIFLSSLSGSSGTLFGFDCAATPVFYSGTYPACPGHPLCGTSFTIHE